MAIDCVETLGSFLRERRDRADPARYGLSVERRRAPGLRREELAHRAEVSVTWYTWLEQGRGGSPSAGVLERISDALELNADEREHLFLLAQQRPPEHRYALTSSVDAKLQAVLDAFSDAAAIVRDPYWNVLAWNQAALAVLTDYSSMAPADRNVLRILFCDEQVRCLMPNWKSDARAAVASFRREVTRANAVDRIQWLIDELKGKSADFADIWEGRDVGSLGVGRKVLDFDDVGRVLLDYSAFAIEGQPELGVIVYNPATDDDRRAVRELITRRSAR